MVRFRVVNIQLEGSGLVSLDQGEEVLRLVQDRVGTDDVVGEGPQPRSLGGTRGLHFQNVPDVLVGTLKRAEPDGDA